MKPKTFRQNASKHTCKNGAETGLNLRTRTIQVSPDSSQYPLNRSNKMPVDIRD